MVATPRGTSRPGARLAVVAAVCVITIAVLAVVTLGDDGGSGHASGGTTSSTGAKPREDGGEVDDDHEAAADHDDAEPSAVRHDPAAARATASAARSRRSRWSRPGSGIVLAQNMMYQHTITVYSSAGDLVATIPDSVDLARVRRRGSSGDLARRTGRGRVLARRARASTSRTTRCTAAASGPRAPTRAHRRRDTTTATSTA